MNKKWKHFEVFLEMYVQILLLEMRKRKWKTCSVLLVFISKNLHPCQRTRLSFLHYIIKTAIFALYSPCLKILQKELTPNNLLLGRAWHLKEAYDFIIELPIKPDAILWRSLMSASNVHGDFAMAEKVGKILPRLELRKSSVCMPVTSV